MTVIWMHHILGTARMMKIRDVDRRRQDRFHSMIHSHQPILRSANLAAPPHRGEILELASWKSGTLHIQICPFHLVWAWQLLNIETPNSVNVVKACVGI